MIKPLLALALLCLPLAAQRSSAFPVAPPAEHGVDPEALELLAEEVQRFVDADALVGAELHVIKDRRTLLHQAFGFADRESERALEVDSVFCVRSMTKPLGGTAIQMLLDEGRLTLETKASEILPFYDTPATAGITVEHLLTHTTGLPFTTITRPLTDYTSIRDVAVEAAGTELLFPPGTGFQYSDAGSDTLGALVAEITGEPVEAFLQRRLIDPLDMRDTWTLLEPGSPALGRIPSAYSGSIGSWSRHWKPSGPPIFPIFLTSQGLYSTTSDYARFLALWMDGGRGLISEEAVARGLTPRNELPSPTGFGALTPSYGQQWVLYADADGDVEIFGHSGSDGTHAWVWPERDLMVLFFTQSRGTLAGIELEGAIERLLIEGDLGGHRERQAARALASADLEPYEGLYWDETNTRAYYVVRKDGDHLVIERPGAFTSALTPTETRGHFSVAREPSRILEFETPLEGASEAFLFPFSEHTERQARYRSNPNLPSAESVLENLHAAHGLDAVASLGVVRMVGAIDVGRPGPPGRVELYFDGSRLRLEASLGPSTERVWITADGRVVSQVNGAEPNELQGAEREQALLTHPIRRMARWREDYAELQVLRPIVDGVHARLLVRAVSHSGGSATKLIDLETDYLADEDRIEIVPGLGEVGLQVAYRDFRDVEGVMLPFTVNSRYGHPFLPKIQVTFETVETRVEAEGDLQPPDVAVSDEG
jgi:CubicO group peptidase (beta-lactamase class C family)